MKQLFTLGEAAHEVGLTRPEDGYRLLHGGGTARVSLAPLGGSAHILTVDGRPEPIDLAVDGDTVHVHLGGATYSLRWTDPVTRYAEAAGGASGAVAAAPMPGTVVTVFVVPGQAVAAGEALLVIESMKLETTLKAARAGTVETVHVGTGSTFERGAVLVTLAAEG